MEHVTMDLTGILFFDEETKKYGTRLKEIPEVIGQGSTEEEAKADLVKSLGFWIKFRNHLANKGKDTLDNNNDDQEFNLKLQTC